MDKRWIVQDLETALEQLAAALHVNPSDDLGRAGCIQYFEFCFELSWKAIKIVGSQLGLDECLSPKSCLRMAFGQAWIDADTIWLEMLDARNRMSHTYDAKSALKVYARLPDFLAAMQSLRDALIQQTA
jgi:nucleotidyltransferase substrate binding protein (TIGR01987 family)